MSRVFWDTNLFIYLFEDSSPLGDRVRRLRTRMIERGDSLLTSALTLGEILVKPTELQRPDLANRYRSAITQVANIIPFDTATAPQFAELRANLNLKSPDAIQLSCAAAAGTDLFITNDTRLSNVSIPGIQFVVSLHSSPI